MNGLAAWGKFLGETPTDLRYFTTRWNFTSTIKIDKIAACHGVLSCTCIEMWEKVDNHIINSLIFYFRGELESDIFKKPQPNIWDCVAIK